MGKVKPSVPAPDTICAVATPKGLGGIAVVRISGPLAIDIADRVWKGRELAAAESHTAHLGTITDPCADNAVIDEAVATVFRAPRSFTGENVVELSIHGSTWIQREVVNLLIRCGCRMAEAGEFTRRAFTNGRLDLTEAEAVADLIASSSRASHHVAISQMRGQFSRRLTTLHDSLLDLASLLELELDFSEEDVEFASRDKLRKIADEILAEVSRLAASYSTGSVLKEGVPVAIVGSTNVGKSTLLNLLLGDDKAIVSDVHGTTRDIIEDTAEIDSVLYRFIDTAGLRDTADEVESIGIQRAKDRMERARIIVWVVDPTEPYDTSASLLPIIGETDNDECRVICAINKTDLVNDAELRHFRDRLLADMKANAIVVEISAKNGNGIDNLRKAIAEASGVANLDAEAVVVTNARHYEALVNAQKSIERVVEGLSTELSADFIAQDVRETLHHLGEITGRITTDTILTTIFSRFCVGK